MNKHSSEILIYLVTFLVLVSAILYAINSLSDHHVTLGPHSSFNWSDQYDATLSEGDYVLTHDVQSVNADYFQIEQGRKPPLQSTYQEPGVGKTTPYYLLEAHLQGNYIMNDNGGATIYSLAPTKATFTPNLNHWVSTIAIAVFGGLIIWCVLILAVGYYDDH